MELFEDSGWIKGLPDGWVDGLICARRLYALLKVQYADADPAPWHEVINAEYWGPYGGDRPEEYTIRQKLTARLVATFQRAMFANELSPAFFDGSNFHAIPAAAFLRDKIVEGGLRDGGLEIDPLWPDDWQLWANHGWAIPKPQFQEWLASERALTPEALPPNPEQFGVSSIPLITHRQPSQSGRVSLSEAVTWIAFGIALDGERLSRALRWQRLAGGDLEMAQHMIEDAAHRLLCAGSDKRVSFFGRHLQHRNDRGQRMEAIDPLALDDYRQLLIVGDNALHYGEGLAMRYRAINDAVLETSVRSDYFNNVTVDRAELLKFFPGTLDSMRALTMPLPALLPGIGAVIGLEEAVCWLAYGRPSHDTAVYADGEGNLIFRDPDGAEVPDVLVGEMPAHLVAFIGANKAIWAALQDGTLRGLVAPAEGAALSIPRVYWTSLNRECLEYLYHGTASSDAGRGCPVLLSRQAFDDWRAMLPQPAKPDKGVNVKAARKRPGPAPDPDWPHALAKVTQDCIAAGYKHRRKRGDKAAIQTMLLNFMAAKDKHFSEDIAAKYAEKVIAALPDN